VTIPPGIGVGVGVGVGVVVGGICVEVAVGGTGVGVPWRVPHAARNTNTNIKVVITYKESL
jgi:hypothetical protein